MLGHGAGETGDGNHVEGLGSVNPVAHSFATRGDTEDLHGHDDVIKERHQSMDRANKVVLTKTPSHHLREPHGGENSGHRLRQDLGGGPAVVDHGGGQIVALVGGLGFELIDRHPGLLGKSLGRLGG